MSLVRLVYQWTMLMRVKSRRRRREAIRVEATARRLLATLDDPDQPDRDS